MDAHLKPVKLNRNMPFPNSADIIKVKMGGEHEDGREVPK